MTYINGLFHITVLVFTLTDVQDCTLCNMSYSSVTYLVSYLTRTETQTYNRDLPVHGYQHAEDKN